MPRVELSSAGIVLGEREVPLYAGSVHYWRLDREVWRDALIETKRLGVTLIDTYVPWSVHETSPGEADFGEMDPLLDVGAFLELIQELGLYAIVRPGPHINAELTFFGIPERVIWDPACQAQSPKGNPVILPMIPVGFPVPSYASETFLTEAERWLALAGAKLAPYRYPEGPIVLCQIDNEGTFYFRDGLYDQDYRPEAILLYRRFLQEKYGTETDLALAYGKRADPWDRIVPPTIFDAVTADDLTFHLDWAEFQERLLAGSMLRMRRAIDRAGLSNIPTFHNMTMGHEATPLSARHLSRVVDFVGLDYYHRATATDRVLIERRTTELAARGEGAHHPAFACEMGAGFPPYFFPIHEEADSQFNVLTALAYGLRGFNIYMAVDRDRWIGAPIDRDGVPGPAAPFWTKLCAALTSVQFHELVRKTPVRIVNTALKRRLNRALHAFSPATPALFAILGKGSHETCYEDDFGLGGTVAAEVDAFIDAFEQALTLRGVPFAHVDGESADISLGSADWIICPTAGGVDPTLWRELLRRAHEGARVTIGPRTPFRDQSLRPLAEPLDASGFDLVGTMGGHPHMDLAIVEQLVEETIRERALPVTTVIPSSISLTVHEDKDGTPRVLFAINPHRHAERALVTFAGCSTLTDLFENTQSSLEEGAVSIVVPGRSVRMFKLNPA